MEAKEKTKAKGALILAGVCNTISSVIHLAIIGALLFVAIMCWNSDASLVNAVTPVLQGMIDENITELLVPVILRVVFLVLVSIAFNAFIIFVFNLSVAIDCYVHANKAPKEAYECKKGLGLCGFFEILGALVLGGIAAACALLPSLIAEIAEYEVICQYGLIGGAVIAGLLLICAIIKFCASSALASEHRKEKKKK